MMKSLLQPISQTSIKSDQDLQILQNILRRIRKATKELGYLENQSVRLNIIGSKLSFLTAPPKKCPQCADIQKNIGELTEELELQKLKNSSLLD